MYVFYSFIFSALSILQNACSQLPLFFHPAFLQLNCTAIVLQYCILYIAAEGSLQVLY